MPGPFVSESSPRNFLSKRSSIFATSALSVNLRRMTRALGERDVHLLVELLRLVAGDHPVAGVDLEDRRELLAHLVGEVVALVADRLFDLDGVDEAHSAAEVEPRHDREGDAARVTYAGHGILSCVMLASVGQRMMKPPMSVEDARPRRMRQPASMTGSA